MLASLRETKSPETGRASTVVTYKVNTDSRDVRLGVSVISESQKQARLSDTGVTDEEELQAVVSTKSLAGCDLSQAHLDQKVVMRRRHC